MIIGIVKVPHLAKKGVVVEMTQGSQHMLRLWSRWMNDDSWSAISINDSIIIPEGLRALVKRKS
jgi:hypothetical protein